MIKVSAIFVFVLCCNCNMTLYVMCAMCVSSLLCALQRPGQHQQRHNHAANHIPIPRCHFDGKRLRMTHDLGAWHDSDVVVFGWEDRGLWLVAWSARMPDIFVCETETQSFRIQHNNVQFQQEFVLSPSKTARILIFLYLSLLLYINSPPKQQQRKTSCTVGYDKRSDTGMDTISIWSTSTNARCKFGQYCANNNDVVIYIYCRPLSYRRIKWPQTVILFIATNIYSRQNVRFLVSLSHLSRCPVYKHTTPKYTAHNNSGLKNRLPTLVRA